jgi:hypothetical protein
MWIVKKIKDTDEVNIVNLYILRMLSYFLLIIITCSLVIYYEISRNGNFNLLFATFIIFTAYFIADILDLYLGGYSKIATGKYKTRFVDPFIFQYTIYKK